MSEEEEILGAFNLINDVRILSQGEFEDVKKAHKVILNLIEEQEQTSHYIQSQLDIANAKIIEQEKRNKKLRNKNQELLQKLRNRVKQVEKLERYGLYKKEFSNLNKRIAELEEINEKHRQELQSADHLGSVEFIKANYISKAKIKEIVNNNQPHIAQEKLQKLLEE